MMSQTVSENHYQVSRNSFFCRTQAGFNQSLRKFVGGDDRLNTVKKDLRGYPLVYPCLVVFSWCYHGHQFVNCTTFPINRLKDIIDKDREIQTALPETEHKLDKQIRKIEHD